MKLYHKSKKNYKYYITITIATLFMLTTLISVGFGALNNDMSIAGDIEFTQDTGNMIMPWDYAQETDFHSLTYRNNIKTVDFLDNKNIPNNAVETWDISLNGDGKVIAWLINDPENEGYYKLYIGANGDVVANPDSSHLFFAMQGLEAINFNNNFSTNYVTNMSYMFVSCTSLTSLDVTSLNTSSVTNMKNMFSYCSNLISLDLRHFNTSNVTTMEEMFYACTNLINLDITSFDTSNVTNMSYLFDYCSALTSLDVSSFNTSNVTTMTYMFGYCSNLTSLNLTSFDTSQVQLMERMFCNCINLSQIKISSLWNVSDVLISDSMFGSCSKLPNYDPNYIDKAKAIPTTQGGYLTLDDGKLAIGNYFTMVPDSNSYTIPAYLYGYDESQTINPSELTLWRVININEDGSYEAISDNVSSTEVSFMTDVGYTKLIAGLQNIASKYAKSGYTIGTRCFGYDGQTLTIADTSQYDGQGSISGAPSTISTPTPLSGTGTEYSNGLLGDTLYLRDYLLVKNVYGNLVANKQGTTTPEAYWVASRKFKYDEEMSGPMDVYDFGSRIIDANGDIEFKNIIGFVGPENPMFALSSSYIRPIITLKSSVTTYSGLGTKTNPFTLS